MRRLKELAFLNKGIKLVLIDERPEEPITKVFHYTGGLKDFIEYLNEDKTPIHPGIIYFEGEKDGIKAQIGIQYTDSYSESIFSYVNNIPTREGGTHETGFTNCRNQSIKRFYKKAKSIQGKKRRFDRRGFQRRDDSCSFR